MLLNQWAAGALSVRENTSTCAQVMKAPLLSFKTPINPITNPTPVYIYFFFFNGSTALLLGPGLLFSFVILFKDGRTPWKSDQPVARPLPIHRTT
jgi:hypothetical protein